MPCGVQGGPATFQCLMNKLLEGLNYRIALAYLDTMTVYSCACLECIERLIVVFEVFVTLPAGLKLNQASAHCLNVKQSTLGTSCLTNVLNVIQRRLRM